MIDCQDSQEWKDARQCVRRDWIRVRDQSRSEIQCSLAKCPEWCDYVRWRDNPDNTTQNKETIRLWPRVRHRHSEVHAAACHRADTRMRSTPRRFLPCPSGLMEQHQTPPLGM